MQPSYREIDALLTAPGKPFEIEWIDVDGHTIANWKCAPRTMPEILRQSRRHDAAEFIVYGDERWSFAQHYARVAALSHRLVDDFRLAKGDRVAIAMRNYPEWICVFWAAVCAGGVVVPLNAWWSGEELAYGLNDSGARIVFVDEQRLERLQPLRARLPALEHIVTTRVQATVTGTSALADLLHDASAERPLPAIALHPDDNATLLYTSGTTGFPKGTLGTHRNFCSVALTTPYTGVRTVLRAGGSLEDLARMQQQRQSALLTVPLFHVTGCHGVMLAMLNSGGRLVMMHRWDPAEALDLIERERITLFSGVPTMVWQLLDMPGMDRRELSSVLSVGYGGAPAAPAMLRRITTGLPHAGVSNGWGITETSSAITLISGQDYLERPESVGVPVPVCELKVVDAQGAELPRGAVGELWVRGPNVTRGYWNKPQATAESFTDGWFHTGDIGRIDDEGFVYVVDRAKDMIIRAGENVYCSEVEAALLQYPGIAAACVFGIPHDVLGEEVAAVVQTLDQDGVTEADLRQHLEQKLARFKIPGRIWLRTEPLPMGATGKLQKKEIKAQYLARLPSA